MVEPKPKFKPSGDLLKRGADAALAQAKKLKIDVSKSAPKSPASLDVSSVVEPVPNATDAIDAQIRRKGRRRQGGKSQRKEQKSEPVPEPKAEPITVAAGGSVEKSEDEQRKAFMESVSNGRPVVFVNKKSGIRKTYHWDGGDFIVGKTAKGRVATADVWERQQDKDNWTWEVAPADGGPLLGDPAVDAAVALRDSERSFEEKERKGDDKDVTTLQATEEKEYTEKEYAKGDVFAKQYLDLNPPRETEKATVEHEEVPIVADEKKGAALEQEIARLKGEVEDLRTRYAKADYDETNAWARVKKFFGKNLKNISFKNGLKLNRLDEKQWQIKRYGEVGSKEKESSEEEIKYQDRMYWQAEYQNKLFDLKNAQLALIKERADAGVGWKQERDDMVKFFDKDEVTNLIDARMQYYAGKQPWLTKAFDSFNAAGRAYNSIPIERKRMYTGVFLGLAALTALPVGASAAGVMAAVVVLRRSLASAGLAVGTEALLDSSREKYRSKKTEKEIEKLDREMSTKGFESLKVFMEQKAFSIDDELQKAKLTKLLHKVGALTFGVLVGNGWLTEIVMDKWGGNELLHSTKEYWGNVLGGTGTSGIRPSIPAVPVESAPELPVRLGIAGGDYPLEPESGLVELGGGVDGIGQGIVPPIVPGVEAGIIKPDFINEFINQEIIVQKGDSVWKIAGRLADQLSLEGSQKTHFIDALKDRYGDVLLKEGQTINFSAHGIDKEFVEHAMGQANALRPEQIASIETNDAKIAEFAATNPHVTLTNESVDTILHGNVADTVSGKPSVTIDAPGSGGADTVPGQPIEIDVQDQKPLGQGLRAPSDGPTGQGLRAPEGISGMVDETVTAVADNDGPAKTKIADFRFDRDIILGAKYDVTAYKEFFKLNPEAFTQFKKIGESYMGFIFQGNQDAMDAIGGKTFGELKSLPNESFGKFVKLAQETYGSKFGLPNPKEQVYAYIARLTMLGMEYPGAKRIILPQYI